MKTIRNITAWFIAAVLFLSGCGTTTSSKKGGSQTYSIIPSSTSQTSQGGKSQSSQGGNTQSSSQQAATSYVVSFQSNGGTAISSIKVNDGETVSKPADPVREGFSFAGWYLDSGLTNPYDFSAPVHTNLILYAKWTENATQVFIVGFISNGNVLFTQEVEAGGVLAQPEDPELEGYTFVGWFTNPSFSEKYDFSTKVNSSFDLYAKWSTTEYIVTFNLNYGGLGDITVSTVDGYITFIPERSGYVFNGWWYCDGFVDGEPVLTTCFSLDTKVTSDGLVLYADWVEEKQLSSQLDAPAVSIDSEQGLIYWEAIEHATKYNVVISNYANGTSSEVVNTSISQTRYTFPSELSAGTYTIKVRAIGDSVNYYNSFYTTRTYAHKVLTSIRNFSYNENRRLLQWDEVKHATSYLIRINNYSDIRIYDNYYDFYNIAAGDYSIRVTAEKEGYVSSSASFNFTKHYLSNPINLTAAFNNDTGEYNINWSGVSKANSYKVYINEKEVGRTSINSYTIPYNSRYFTNEKLTFAVTAFDSNSDYLMSDLSEQLTLTAKYLVTFTTYLSNDKVLEQKLYLEKGEANVFDYATPNGTEIERMLVNGSQLTDKSLPYNYVCEGHDGSVTVYYALTEQNQQSLVDFTYYYDNENRLVITGVVDNTISSITIPAIAYRIEDNAFADCLSLMEISVAGGNEYYSSFDGALYNKDQTQLLYCPFSRTSLVVSDNTTLLNKGVLQNCSSLETITLPFIGESTSTNQFLGYIFGASSYSNNSTYVPASLKTVIVSDKCTSINQYAFYNCSSLTSIVTSNTVTTIGGYAFSSCSSLTSIVISNSLTTISRYVFYNCSSLTSITIPDSVTSIEQNAFQNCSSLTSIAISNNLALIGQNAFQNCSSLMSIVVPDTVTTIGEGAFQGCSSLESMTLPFIGGSASGNQYLGYIFGGSSSFNNSTYVPTSLKTVIISDVCTSIDTNAFYRCSSLTSITIGKGISLLSSSYFAYCSSLVEVKVADGNATYSSHDGVLYSKDQTTLVFCPQGKTTCIISEGCTSIADSAFNGCSLLESVTIPNSITSIGKNAFYNCSSLASVTIPNGVTFIGSYAFYNCSSLTSVVIPDTMTTIERGAFSGCSSLESMTLPFIGESALSNNNFFGYIFGASSYSDNSKNVPTSLKTVIISDGCTSIIQYAFSGCSGITSIIVPNTVITIGQGAFQGCSSLETITLPFIGGAPLANQFFGYIFGASSYLYNSNNVPASLKTVIISDGCTSIPSNSFYQCSKITSITIPTSVTSIGNSAFSQCIGLTSITIPTSVTSIGNSAFSGCTRLTSIIIPESVTAINAELFYSCSSLTSVTIPESVTSIGNSAFYNCSKITSITIPSSVKTIGISAFNGCRQLTSITIPESVTSIGKNAFFGCNLLTTIVVPNGVTTIGQSAFQNCSSLESITLPFIGGSASSNQFLGYIFGASSYTDNSNKVPTSLKTVIVSDVCASIGENAFYGCSTLTLITIGKGTSLISGSAFDGCSSLVEINVANENTTYSSFDGALYNKDQTALVRCPIGKTTCAISDKCTSIADSAFNGCSSLAEINATNENTTYSSFDGALYSKDQTTLVFCPQAKSSITIPNSVTSIGQGAFQNCSSLTNVVVPNSVTSIGQGAFQNCLSLESITLPFIGGSASSNQFLGYIFGASSYTDNSNKVPTSLKTVIISDGCTSISQYAFYGCSGITSIVVPNSITTIEQGTFQSCSSLESITLPFVGESALSNQFLGFIFGGSSYSDNSTYVPTSLRKVILSDACSSIVQNAFYNCSKITSVTIPNTVLSIGKAAFQGCSRLQSITLPFIGGSASTNQFLGYIFGGTTADNNSNKVPSSLRTVVILDGCTSIANFAFTGCSSLTSITIPNSVQSIGNYAFQGCSSLTSITIPNSVQSIGNYAFNSGTSLRQINVDDGNEIYSSIDGVLYNKDQTTLIFCPQGKTSITIPNTVISIANGAFYFSSITSIVLPNSLTSIDEGAFLYSKLTSITIPNNVTSISPRAFANCNSLVTVVLLDGVISIGESAFSNCSKLTSITIPSSVQSIDKSAFYDCSLLLTINVADENEYYSSIDGVLYNKDQTTLIRCPQAKTSITIPNTVTSIGESAFSGCKRLTSIIVPNGVTLIGIRAFQNCSSLESITLPFIGESASTNQFLGYIFGASSYSNSSNIMPTSLKTVIISDACISISQNAFYGCSSLTSITFSSSISSIPASAFSGCSSLLTINVADENEYFSSIDGILYNKNQTTLIRCPQAKTSITIPNTVTLIGENSFRGCSLTSITIPNSVTTIGESAFQSCTSLTSIKIPNSVTSISRFAFENCQYLTSVILSDSVTSIGNGAFQDCYRLVYIVIPSSVTSIGNYVFDNTYELESIFYKGTAEQLSSSGIQSALPQSVTVYYYSETTPISSGNYWHYVNGVPTKW